MSRLSSHLRKAEKELGKSLSCKMKAHHQVSIEKALLLITEIIRSMDAYENIVIEKGGTIREGSFKENKVKHAPKNQQSL